jgi:hypothetical protein
LLGRAFRGAAGAMRMETAALLVIEAAFIPNSPSTSRFCCGEVSGSRTSK